VHPRDKEENDVRHYLVTPCRVSVHVSDPHLRYRFVK
jgi:hypothetical protein